MMVPERIDRCEFNATSAKFGVLLGNETADDSFWKSRRIFDALLLLARSSTCSCTRYVASRKLFPPTDWARVLKLKKIEL